MRTRVARWFLVVAAALLAVPFPSRPAAAEEPDGQLEFDRSLDLLDVVMELRALRTLSERGYYVPTATWKEYADHAAELSAGIASAADRDLDPIAQWVEEREKTAEAEVWIWQKAFEAIGSAAFRGLKAEDDKDRSAGSLGGSSAQNPNLVTPGTLSPVELVKARAEWEQAVLKLRESKLQSALTAYDKSIDLVKTNVLRASGDIDADLLNRVGRIVRRDQSAATTTRAELVKIQQDRRRADACVAAVARVQQGMKALEFIQGSNPDRAAQVIEEAAKAALKEMHGADFGASEEADLKWAIGIGKSVATRTSEAWDALGPLADDPALRRHPETLKLAKQFAVTAAVFGFIGDTFKACDAAAPIAPFFDLVDFYGKAVGVVPEFARVMQGLVDKADQDSLGGRLGSPFRALPGAGEDLWATPLYQAMGVPIGCTHTNPDDPTARFLLVLRPGAKDGYATLTGEQYDQLAAALADERIVNAGNETSRGAFDSLYDRVAHQRSSPVRPDAGSTYLSNLKTNARTLVFSAASCGDLATSGSAATDAGFFGTSKVYNVERLRELRREELRRLAAEILVRETLGGDYEHRVALEWFEFRAVLERERPVLAPDQIINLFNFWQQRGARQGLIEATLKKVAADQNERARGRIRVGFGALQALPSFDPIKPGDTITLEASFVVGEMAPDRRVEATLEWMLPSWAVGQSGTDRVQLENGLFVATRKVRIPKKGAGAFDAKVRLAFDQPSSTSSTPSATPTDVVGGSAGIALKSRTGAATQAVVEGAERFDIDEAVDEGVSITARRWPHDSTIATSIEVRSAALGKLDEKDGASGFKFKLYRAYGASGANAADGPFEALDDYYAGYCFGDSPIAGYVDSPSYTGYRIALDTFAVVDRITPALGIDAAKGRKPAWYQVGQIPIRKVNHEIREIGPEIKSAVFAPTQDAYLSLRYNKNPDGTPRNDEVMYVDALFGLASQYYDLPNAHSVVQYGGRTWHVWGPSFSVLTRPEGGNVLVQTDGDGLAASAAIVVPAAPARVKAVQASIAAQQQDLPSLEAYVAKKTEEHRARLADVRKRQAAGAQRSDFSWATSERLWHAQDALATRDAIEYDGPTSILSARRALALTAGDYAAALAHAESELTLVDAYAAAVQEFAAEVQAVSQAVEAIVRSDDQSKNQQDAMRMKLRALPPIQVLIDGRRDTAWTHVEHTAVLAGNAARYEQAVEARVAIAKNQELQSGMYESGARVLVAISGDQAKAAAWRLKARDLLIAAKPAEADRIRADWDTRLPLWWPQSGR